MDLIQISRQEMGKGLCALHIIENLENQEARITFVLISHHHILYNTYQHMVTCSSTKKESRSIPPN